jgi:predicted anti-sigma-YlaC factor YlaD
MGRLRNAWRLLHLPCEGMTRLASESLDRRIGRLERLVLRSHLLYCVPCRRYARQITILRQALRRLAARLEADEDLPGPDLPIEIRDKLKRRLEEG